MTGRATTVRKLCSDNRNDKRRGDASRERTWSWLSQFQQHMWTPTTETFAPWWKLLPRRWGHPWHAMCSYLAMFPPCLPRYFIEQCSRPGDVVLDPFSGRGTTALEACVAGRIGVGTDANPLAALLTAAKVDPPSLPYAFRRVEELRALYDRSKVQEHAPSEIRLLFDGRRTLPQLLFVRRRLSQRSRVDRHLLAVLCGVLHGNHPRDPRTARTLSISMPNTFSMSPGYIARYKRKWRLRKYPFDVFDALGRRLEHLNRVSPPQQRGLAWRCDARSIQRYVEKGSVSLIVTSPPYLSLVRYGKYNWIRLWLLQQSVEQVDELAVEASDRRLDLSDRLRPKAYLAFLEKCITRCSQVLKPGGVAAFVIGDVVTDGSQSLNLAAEVWRHIRRTSPLQLVDIIEDELEVGGKVTRIWGARRGQATRMDRILILKKAGARRYRRREPVRILAEMSASRSGDGL